MWDPITKDEDWGYMGSAGMLEKAYLQPHLHKVHIMELQLDRIDHF